MTQKIHRNCPLCSTDNREQPTLHYSRDEWQLKECVSCGFVYLENAIQYEELSENFAWEKTSEIESKRRDKSEPFLRCLSLAFKQFRNRVIKRNKLPQLVNRYIPLGKSVVDIGCAGGNVIRQISESYQPIGVEISKELAQSAQHKYPNSRIIHAPAVEGLQQLANASCGGVIMSAFLEHEINPLQLMQETFRVLEHGGVAIIKVPNFASLNRVFRKNKWCGFRFPDHVNYFTPKTITALSQKCGFTLQQFNFFDKLPTSDNLWIVVVKL